MKNLHKILHYVPVLGAVTVLLGDAELPENPLLNLLWHITNLIPAVIILAILFVIGKITGKELIK